MSELKEYFLKGFTSIVELYPKIDLPERFNSKINKQIFDNKTTPLDYNVDYKALCNDWMKVENDITKVLMNSDK